MSELWWVFPAARSRERRPSSTSTGRGRARRTPCRGRPESSSSSRAPTLGWKRTGRFRAVEPSKARRIGKRRLIILQDIDAPLDAAGDDTDRAHALADLGYAEPIAHKQRVGSRLAIELDDRAVIGDGGRVADRACLAEIGIGHRVAMRVGNRGQQPAIKMAEINVDGAGRWCEPGHHGDRLEGRDCAVLVRTFHSLLPVT